MVTVPSLLLNAAAGCNPFSTYGSMAGWPARAELPGITALHMPNLPGHHHVFTVAGTNGYVSAPNPCMWAAAWATVAIINAPTGLDLTVIEVLPASSGYNSACFRVCNLAYYSGRSRVHRKRLFPCHFKDAASFSSLTQAAICCLSQDPPGRGRQRWSQRQ